MGQRYTVRGTVGSVTTAKTIWQVTAHSSVVILLWRARLYQLTKALAADAQTVEWTLQRASAAGSSPTSVTPEKTGSGLASFKSTFGQAPSGSPTLAGSPLFTGGFNNVGVSDDWEAQGPAGAFEISPGGILVCQTQTTLASSTIGFFVELEELGG